MPFSPKHGNWETWAGGMRRMDVRALGWRLAVEVGAERGNRFTGDYGSWQEALRCADGYDQPQILDKAVAAMRAVRDGHAAYERDTVVFDRMEYTHPLLAWLLYAAGREDGRLSVLDFGGALGSSYYQHRGLLGHLRELKWGVVEQAHYVEAGRAEFRTAYLDYFYQTQECMQAITPNFMLLSSVLQYLTEPWAMLEDFLGLGVPYVLIDRTMAQRLGPDRLVVQSVPPSIYPASYPAWMLDASRLEECFSRCNYEVMDCYDPCPGSHFGPEGFQSPYMAWFLRKR